MKMRAFVLCLLAAVPAVAFAATNELCNDDWVIPSKGVHPLSFESSRDSVMHAEVTGVKGTAKGFTVRLVPEAEYSNCINGGPCNAVPGFTGTKVGSFDHTERLPVGRWIFYVANTENILFSMTVHVHVSGTAN
jgi:hypothetical protein